MARITMRNSQKSTFAEVFEIYISAELFKIIATEMMGVALTERGIDATLRENLFPKESHNYRFSDTQLIKKILNQLKALNLGGHALLSFPQSRRDWMAFKRSAVRSRLSPPRKETSDRMSLFYFKSRGFLAGAPHPFFAFSFCTVLFMGLTI